jgi:hypothetical protein
VHVVQRRFNRFQAIAAVHAPPAAIAHRRALERTLVVPAEPGRVRYETAAAPNTPL